MFKPSFKKLFYKVKKESVKYEHYLDVYDRYLEKYRKKPIKLLEIGVRRGGSIQMFKRYFRKGLIYGLDIDPVAEFEEDRIKILIGDQADTDLLLKISDKHGPFDVVIDDGSHYMIHQILSFAALYPELAEDGTYIIEDVHTSYWDKYGGNLHQPITAVGLGKDLADCVNWWAFNWDYENEEMNKGVSEENKLFKLNKTVGSVHFHDSMIVVEKHQSFKKPEIIKSTNRK